MSNVRQIEDKQSYKTAIPFLIHLAKARAELFNNAWEQQKLIDLLEGCSSAEELRAILAFPQMSKFIKDRIITFE